MDENRIIPQKVVQSSGSRKSSISKKEFDVEHICSDNEPDSCDVKKKTSSSPLLNLKLGNVSIGKKELSWCFSDIESFSDSSSESETKRTSSFRERRNSSSDDESPIISNTIVNRNILGSDDEVQAIAKPVRPSNRKKFTSDEELQVTKKKASPVPVTEQSSIATPITFRLHNVKKLTPVKNYSTDDYSEEPSFFLKSLSSGYFDVYFYDKLVYVIFFLNSCSQVFTD